MSYNIAFILNDSFFYGLEQLTLLFAAMWRFSRIDEHMYLCGGICRRLDLF